MATATKTYNFTGSAEGWSWTTVSGTPTSATYNNNRLEYASPVGRRLAAKGYWSISGTFASIFGINASDTVTGYSGAAFNGACTSYDNMAYFYEADVDAVYGALNINDGTDRIIIPNQSTYTGAPQTHTPSIDPKIEGLSLPGSTSITLRLYVSSGNGNVTTSNATGYVDDISVSIEYTSGSSSRRVFMIT